MKTFKQKIDLHEIENFIISQLSRQAHFNIFFLNLDILV